MLAGPLDLCNGWFGLNDAFGNGRHKVFENIPGTVAAEVAKLIVVYGGCFVLPDAPEEYLKKEDLFDCIRQMPAHFESYKVVAGEIGEFITVARKSGNEWFVGSLTNRQSRELEINFNFLNEGKKYIATFYEDTPETDFMNNKEDYRIRENIQVDKNSLATIKLAAGGGNAIWIRPVN
jgi:alpha-glucosidase